MGHQAFTDLSRESRDGCDHQDGTDGNPVRHHADDARDEVACCESWLMRGRDEFVQVAKSLPEALKNV